MIFKLLKLFLEIGFVGICSLIIFSCLCIIFKINYSLDKKHLKINISTKTD